MNTIKYSIRRFSIYLRAIWNIVEVIECLEASGYIMKKNHTVEFFNRERLNNNKILLKIGSWRIK